MKKNLILIFFCCFFSINTFAQKKVILSKYAIETSESGNGMSPVVYKAKNLVVDDANGYVFQHVTSTYNGEVGQNYISWGLWKTPKEEIIGSFMVSISASGSVSSSIDSYLQFNLNFTKYGTQEALDIYNKKEVQNALEAELNKITARGAEGTEIFYAEIPRKGTTIGLFIVYGSEIKANKGIPKWKMKFGELVFDKKTGKFTFIKSK